MHDIKALRDDPAAFDAALARRGVAPVSAELLAIDEKRRACIQASETALAERNAASKQVGKAKASGDEAEFERLRALVGEKKDEIAKLEADAKEWDEKLHTALMGLPNLPHPDTPDGAGEEENVEAKRWGEQPAFDFEAKEHYVLAEAMGLLDMETAAKISGARFMLLSGAIARLHRSLGGFMIDHQTEQNGLTEVWTPALVRDDALLGTGQLPKFSDDLFKAGDHWLIPTAEVTLTNIVAGHILDESYLPRRYCAWTSCFRSEAGSAGRDTAGILRQHQFEKVEMVSVTTPEASMDELERMTRCAESVLEALELPYRRMTLCTGDMGFGARMTHDLEVWLPGQGKYREISSCSVCGDFQARRMNTRYRKDGEKKTNFVHTLNGSGLAVGRALIAVLENYQDADGGVRIPKALQQRMGGAERIGPDGALS